MDERIYICPECRFVIDRDYNSALNDMHYGIIKINELLKNKYNKINKELKKYSIKVPMERLREFTPVEIDAPALEGLNINPYVRVSIVHESGSLIALA